MSKKKAEPASDSLASETPSERPAKPEPAPAKGRSGYDSAKLRFVGACAAIAGGLAIAGSLDRSLGGVLVLIGWVASVATLHRLGRSGSKAS